MEHSGWVPVEDQLLPCSAVSFGAVPGRPPVVQCLRVALRKNDQDDQDDHQLVHPVAGGVALVAGCAEPAVGGAAHNAGDVQHAAGRLAYDFCPDAVVALRSVASDGARDRSATGLGAVGSGALDSTGAPHLSPLG